MTLIMTLPSPHLIFPFHILSILLFSLVLSFHFSFPHLSLSVSPCLSKSLSPQFLLISLLQCIVEGLKRLNIPFTCDSMSCVITTEVNEFVTTSNLTFHDPMRSDQGTSSVCLSVCLSLIYNVLVRNYLKYLVKTLMINLTF